MVLSPKEDLSGVGFWDVFLCRKHKWLDYELVNSTKSFTLKGKDIKTVIDNGLSYGVINRHYIDYKDTLYYVQYGGVIEDDKIYEMVYDSLSLDAKKINMRGVDCYMGYTTADKVGLLEL